MEPVKPATDTKIADQLDAFIKKMSGMGNDEQKLAIASLAGELVRSTGLKFSGASLPDGGPKTKAMAEALAKAMGSKYRKDGTVHAYLFPRGSESGAGAVFYTDAKTGDLMTLFERPKRDANGWEYPAGYREMKPEPGVAAAKPAIGEATEAALKAAFTKELKAMLEEGKTAREIIARFDSPQEVQAIFKKHGIDWNKEHDATLQDAFTREVMEETNVDLSKARIGKVHSFGTVSEGASITRVNHTDHFYYADLGKLDKAPAIKIQESEITEAKWVRVKDMQRDAKGIYTIKGEKPGLNTLRFEMGHRFERALEERLNAVIKDISTVKTEDGPESRFDSVRDVSAALRIEGGRQKPGPSAALTLATQASDIKGNVKLLTGEEGAKRIEAVLKAAKGLANGEKIESIFPPDRKERGKADDKTSLLDTPAQVIPFLHARRASGRD